jgi:MSHA biogenesis protein MshN
MSLINKMLQDLDARGDGKHSPSGEVRPVVTEGPRRALTAITVGALVGALILAGGAGWYVMHRPATVADMAAPAPAPAPASAPVIPPKLPAAPVEVAAVDAPPVAAEPASVPAPPTGAPRERSKKEPKPARAPHAVPAAAVPPATGSTLTPQQRGENAYRRALVAVQEGRVQDGIAALEGAVAAYPRHEAARQTLVGLLLETGRTEDAVRHAALALALNPNQPQLAMLLARLQLEAGGPAVETLQRTLPNARDNADYLALLAGVLQKGGRHAEAAEQYEAALRLQPTNGVWWMGLGISRQAERLNSNAREAYLKAKAAGLTAQLQAFVDRRLAQLDGQ